MNNLKRLGSIVEEFKDDITPKIKAVALNEFLALELPPLLNLLDPWLHESSLTLVYAERGIGKTYFCLEIAMAVASGGNFLAYSAPKAARVLYIDGEMTAPDLQNRLKKIKDHLPNFEKDFIEPIFITPDLQDGYLPDLSSSNGREALKKYTDQADLIIVDNISTLCGSIQENVGDDWVPIQRWALRLRSQGKSVLFVHHAGKGGNQRGTSRREDILDTVIKLKRPSDYEPSMNACFEIHFEKSRRVYGDKLNPILCRFNNNEWVYETLKESHYNKVVTLANEGLSQKDITDQTGISKGYVSKIIKKARADGKINT